MTKLQRMLTGTAAAVLLVAIREPARRRRP